MMWSTNVENISSRRNSFGLGPHFCQQNKHISLKKMIIRNTCKDVNCFSNIARVKYSIVTFHLHRHRYLLLLRWQNLYRHHTNQLARKVRRLYMKAWNFIKIDFDQGTGKEYSTIVQIIDRWKAIAWCSVSCKTTCYHIPDGKAL